MKPKNKPSKIFRTRKSRKKSTPAEKMLWQYLRDRKFHGKKFSRRHLFRGYVLDFYCAKDKLTIELYDPARNRQNDNDFRRYNNIEAAGVRILRFSNQEVLENITRVLRSIKSCLILSR